MSKQRTRGGSPARPLTRRVLALTLGVMTVASASASLAFAFAGLTVWSAAAFLALLPALVGALALATDHADHRVPPAGGVDPEARSVWQALRRMDASGAAKQDAEMMGIRGVVASAALGLPAVLTYFIVYRMLLEPAYVLAAWSLLMGLGLTWVGLRTLWRFYSRALLGRRQAAPRERWWTSLAFTLGGAGLLIWILRLAQQDGHTSDSPGVGAGLVLCGLVVVYLLARARRDLQSREAERPR